MRLVLLLVITGAAVATVIGAPAKSVAAVDYDCADFSTQASAQTFFLANGGPSSDPYGLDGDNDGIACESNPCPCSTGSLTPPPPSDLAPHPTEHGNVIRAVDGDTIEVSVNGVEETVRLIGIDTPESVKPRTPVECGAKQASRSMHHMARPGDTVALIPDPSQDNQDVYGRLLRYVEEGGHDYGRKQIFRGWAKPYVFQSAFERLKFYKVAKGLARGHNRGVWKKRTCDGDFHSASYRS